MWVTQYFLSTYKRFSVQIPPSSRLGAKTPTVTWSHEGRLQNGRTDIDLQHSSKWGTSERTSRLPFRGYEQGQAAGLHGSLRPSQRRLCVSSKYLDRIEIYPLRYVSDVHRRYTQACNQKVQRGYLLSLWMGLAPNHVMWADLKSKVTDASRKMSAHHDAYKEMLTRKPKGIFNKLVLTHTKIFCLAQDREANPAKRQKTGHNSNNKQKQKKNIPVDPNAHLREKYKGQILENPPSDWPAPAPSSKWCRKHFWSGHSSAQCKTK